MKAASVTAMAMSHGLNLGFQPCPAVWSLI